LRKGETNVGLPALKDEDALRWRVADLEIGDTANLEVCATSALRQVRQALLDVSGGFGVFLATQESLICAICQARH
jgi:hypothetical protein